MIYDVLTVVVVVAALAYIAIRYLTSFTPSLIMRVAIGAWPCPKERAWKRLDIPEFSASCNNALVGSCKSIRNTNHRLAMTVR